MISKSGIQLSIALAFGAVSVASAQNLDQARALLHAGADDAAIRTEVRVLQQLDEDDFLVEIDGVRIILDLDKAALRNLTIGGIYEVIGELEKIRGEKYGVAVNYGIDALIIERRTAGQSLAAPRIVHSEVATPASVTPVQAARPIEITPIESLRRGSFAAIEVTVNRVIDKDEIIVQDASGRIRVDLGNAILSTLRPGQTMVIEGFVDNGPMSFIRREFYANILRLEDGRVIEVRRNDRF